MPSDPCTTRNGTVKRRWATEEAAIFVALWQTTVKRNPSVWYACPACQKWHVATDRSSIGQ